MKYLGTMRTSFLNDHQIRPIEYRKWADARRHFQYGEDLKKLQKLKASIPEHGLLEPIVLGISDRYPDVYVGDGHHRAVALMDLGIPEFPFHWYWIRSFGVRMESEPFPFDVFERG
jgi:hypothetical protein